MCQRIDTVCNITVSIAGVIGFAPVIVVVSREFAYEDACQSLRAYEDVVEKSED